ncbi:MAG: hypothetical protein ABIO55_11115 [Ginsengibacter sp.]
MLALILFSHQAVIIFGTTKYLQWRLAATPAEYKYSSASFYDDGKDDFGLLRNYVE